MEALVLNGDNIEAAEGNIQIAVQERLGLLWPH